MTNTNTVEIPNDLQSHQQQQQQLQQIQQGEYSNRNFGIPLDKCESSSISQVIIIF